MKRRRLVVAISGASAPIYGIRMLEILRAAPDVETHLVLTKGALRTIHLETEMTREQVWELADEHYRPEDMAASIASGSFQTAGMVIAPCSINTMSCIAASITKDLVTRAADVTLKEQRRLVLMIRESPLHLGHIRKMLALAEMGVVIAPPIPSFYHRPETPTDLVDYSVGRVLDLFGIEIEGMKRWKTPSDG